MDDIKKERNWKKIFWMATIGFLIISFPALDGRTTGEIFGKIFVLIFFQYLYSKLRKQPFNYKLAIGFVLMVPLIILLTFFYGVYGGIVMVTAPAGESNELAFVFIDENEEVITGELFIDGTSTGIGHTYIINRSFFDDDNEHTVSFEPQNSEYYWEWNINKGNLTELNVMYFQIGYF